MLDYSSTFASFLFFICKIFDYFTHVDDKALPRLCLTEKLKQNFSGHISIGGVLKKPADK